MREDKIAVVLNDPSVRYWVKIQYRESLKRDPVDALNDAELLVSMLKDRLAYMRAKEG